MEFEWQKSGHLSKMKTRPFDCSFFCKIIVVGMVQVSEISMGVYCQCPDYANFSIGSAVMVNFNLYTISITCKWHFQFFASNNLPNKSDILFEISDSHGMSSFPTCTPPPPSPPPPKKKEEKSQCDQKNCGLLQS